jgi:hypothetical protein
MLFPNRGESTAVDKARETYQHRPHAAVYIRDLAVDKPTNEDVARVTDRSRRLKDLASLRVPPPISAECVPGDSLR